MATQGRPRKGYTRVSVDLPRSVEEALVERYGDVETGVVAACTQFEQSHLSVLKQISELLPELVQSSERMNASAQNLLKNHDKALQELSRFDMSGKVQ